MSARRRSGRHIDGPLSDDVIERDLQRCRAARIADGLPEHLEDPVVLDRIAAIVARFADAQPAV